MVYFLVLVAVVSLSIAVQCRAECPTAVLSIPGVLDPLHPQCCNREFFMVTAIDDAIAGNESTSESACPCELATSCYNNACAVQSDLARTCCGESSALYLVVLSKQLADMLERLASLSISTIARAILELMQQLDWSRIAILADVSDAYFLSTAEELYREADSNAYFTFLQPGHKSSDIEDALDDIEHMDVRIVVVSLSPLTALRVLCRAHERRLAWPNYAWIVHGVQLSNDSCGGQSSQLEGLLIVQSKFSRPEGMQTCWYLSELGRSGCLLRSSVDVHDHCESTVVQAAVSQWLGSNSIPLFTYAVGERLTIANLTPPIPSDLLSHHTSNTASIFSAIFFLGILLCLVVTTLSLVLYFCFHEEPGIKASSVSLSLLIFIGCYLLIIYMLALNATILSSYPAVSSNVRNLVCFIRVWLNALGLPIALILSTLLVKLLRVYRIFNRYSKMGKHSFRNLTLAGMALLLTSPNAVICLLWSTADPYMSEVSLSVVAAQPILTEHCVSTNAIQWLVGLMIYDSVLSVVLVVLAILTRKIRYKDFKDTKKVNILCFVVVLTGVTVLFYWYLARLIQADPILVNALLLLGSLTVVLECQGFIFAPKLLPVLKKRLFHGFFQSRSTSVPSENTISTIS